VNGLAALPFHGNRLVEGWQISGILSAYSGVPFNLYDGYFDRAAFGNTNGPVNNFARPNYISGCNPVAGAQTIAEWFNPNCYALEPAGTFGNTGRNSLRGPGFFNADISLLKDTKINDKLNLQFRAEFFNFLNHENFALPNSVLFSSPAGAISSTAGRITSSNSGSTPRQIQFGLKLNF
jgi:hypothetical protein